MIYIFYIEPVPACLDPCWYRRAPPAPPPCTPPCLVLQVNNSNQFNYVLFFSRNFVSYSQIFLYICVFRIIQEYKQSFSVMGTKGILLLRLFVTQGQVNGLFLTNL